MKLKLVLSSYSVILLLLLNCKKVPLETIVEIPAPTSSESSEPNLHKSKDGTIYLSWIESVGEGKSALKFSKLSEEMTWSEPKLIAQGSDWFVNWADFPAMASFGDHNLASHYLEKSANGTYTYDVKLTISNDNGDSWNQPFIPHTDGTNSEHGFVSKVALADNSLLSIWLDGRQYAYAEENDSIVKEMTLRGAIFSANGDMLKEYLIDERVCDCCQTDATMTEKGPIVVYRNRSEEEVRDIYCSRLVGNEWRAPKPIHNDDWNIAGCPVNGPAIASKGNVVSVAWFTLSDDVPHVKLVFSTNSGEDFGNPIVLNSGSNIGRVDIEMLEDESALVTWVNTIEENTVIQMQRIDKSGNKSEILNLAETTEDRSSGFPRMVVKDDIAYLAYTLSGKKLNIKSLAVNTKTLELIK